MLELFRVHGAAKPQNTHHQFWQQSNKPIVLDTQKKFAGCCAYVRQNPVAAGLVTDECAYKRSSANPGIEIELDKAWISLKVNEGTSVDARARVGVKVTRF